MEIRVRLRPWLESRLNEGWIDGLKWIDKDKGIFKIPWKHHSKHTWTEDDAAIFKDWAVVTGRYRVGIDEPDWPMWKTRLRCALNKAPDIQEVKQRHNLHCDEPFKVYRFISKTEALWRANATRNASMIFDGIGPMQKLNAFGLSFAPYRLCQFPQSSTPGKRPTFLIHRFPANEGSRSITLLHRRDDGVLVKYVPGISNRPILPAGQLFPYRHIPQTPSENCTHTSGISGTALDHDTSIPSAPFRFFANTPFPSPAVTRRIGNTPIVVCNRLLSNSAVSTQSCLPLLPDLLEPESHQLGIRIQHLNVRVKDAIITNPNGCCIYFGRYDEINSLAAPDPMEAQIPHHVSEANKEYVDLLLDNMVRGIILSVIHGNIFAERMCKCAVFVYIPTSDGDHILFKKLGRKDPEKIFDFTEFLRDLRLSRLGQRPKPHFEVVLAFGQQLRSGTSTESLLVWSRVASCRAWFLLQGGSALPLDNNGVHAHGFIPEDGLGSIPSVSNHQLLYHCAPLDPVLNGKRADEYADDSIPAISTGADTNGYYFPLNGNGYNPKFHVLHSSTGDHDAVSIRRVSDSLCDDVKVEQIIEECVEVPLDDTEDLVYDPEDSSVIHRHLIVSDALHEMNDPDTCISDTSVTDSDVFLTPQEPSGVGDVISPN